MIIITIFFLIKLIIEYRILIFKFVEHNNFFMNFILINVYLIFIIICPLIIWYKSKNLNYIRNQILINAICVAFGSVIIILLNNCFRNRNIYPNNPKIWILIISIISYPLFCKIISYSFYNYYIKKYFITCNKLERMLINFFTFYFIMFCYIFKEIGKYRIVYINFLKKKICCSSPFLIYFFILFMIFVEECTRENYFKQNSSNEVLVIINIISLIISLIFSYTFYIEEKKEEKGSDIIIDNLNIQNKERIEEIESNKNLQGIDINNANDKNEPKILIDNEEKNKKRFTIITKSNFPFLKIYLMLIFFWITEESEKLTGIIFIVFLDVLEYLSNYFYAEINEISKKNSEIKNYNEQNLLTHYYIYYIIIQNMFLISNEITFFTERYSLGFEVDKLQGAKGANISKFIYHFLGNLAKYKSNLILIGFFMKKEIINDYTNKSRFSLDFLVRKILLGMRIGLYLIFLFAQILIFINDELFADLVVFGLVNFTLFIFDYLFSGIGYLIKRY